MRAIWNGITLAESDETLVVEGNHYFPPDTVRREYLEESDTRTQCPWKGEASYFHIKVGNARNEDAVWTYRKPKDAAREIQGYVAFWKGVHLE